LSLSGDGTVKGTPSGSGTFAFGVSVNDSFTPQLTASKSFSVTIQPTLTITTSTLQVGVAGALYMQQLSASGPSSVTWSTFSGVLPPGITLSSTGTLAGTPNAQGSFDFTIQASSTDPVQIAKQALRIVINPALAIATNATLPDAPLGSPYSVTLAATGGVSP